MVADIQERKWSELIVTYEAGYNASDVHESSGFG